MLTESEIKNLEPGDPIVIHTRFIKIDEDGDINFESPFTYHNGKEFSESSICPDFVSLPTDSQSSIVNRQSKYDTCRLFKKGDKVQPRSGKTVLASEYGFVTFHELDGQYEVNEDEARGTVTLIVNGHACFVSAFALELVTPVEERNPYSVHEESSHNRWNVIKDKYVHGIHAMFPYKNMGNSDLMSREEAKARADEYCDHLNEEYRKEHGND